MTPAAVMLSISDITRPLAALGSGVGAGVAVAAAGVAVAAGAGVAVGCGVGVALPVHAAMETSKTSAVKNAMLFLNIKNPPLYSGKDFHNKTISGVMALPELSKR